MAIGIGVEEIRMAIGLDIPGFDDVHFTIGVHVCRDCDVPMGQINMIGGLSSKKCGS